MKVKKSEIQLLIAVLGILLRSLAGIVGLDGHTHLHDAPAEDDNAQCLDDGKHKVGQVSDDGKRIVSSQRRAGHGGTGQHDQNERPITAPGLDSPVVGFRRNTVLFHGVILLFIQ